MRELEVSTFVSIESKSSNFRAFPNVKHYQKQRKRKIIHDGNPKFRLIQRYRGISTRKKNTPNMCCYSCTSRFHPSSFQSSRMHIHTLYTHTRARMRTYITNVQKIEREYFSHEKEVKRRGWDRPKSIKERKRERSVARRVRK